MSIDISFEDEILKNKCTDCGKKGIFNYKDIFYGVKCKDHKLQHMVNIHSKEISTIRFAKSIEKLGGKVVGEYINNNTPVECICVNNHKCNTTSASIWSGKGMCRICSGCDFETAKNNFYKNIEKIGGKVIGEYKGCEQPVDCICVNNHKCNPRPNNIQRDRGMCRKCTNKDYDTAKNNFYNSIESLGGKVVGDYITANKPVDCICVMNHKCKSNPSHIQQGRGMCPQCAKQSFSKISFEFLDSISLSQKISLQTAKSEEGEFKISDTNYKVDGYHNETNTVYEFHGCYWHGCPMCFDPEEMNDTANKTFGELHDRTLHREELIKSKGYNLVVMWECDWKEKLLL